ncbi:MAG: hypothetical protein ACJ73S_22240 [Mycobacteriales bacterium]
MRLTGMPFLVTMVVVCATAAAGGGWLWWRARRWGTPYRWGSRAAVLLGCEVLLLLTAGAYVNRQLSLYPTWRSLLGGKPGGVRQASAPPGRLDVSLTAARSAQSATDTGATVPWIEDVTPGAAWVHVPAAYFTRSRARFPVVVVATCGGWGPAGPPADLLRRMDATAAPAVTVFLDLPAGADPAAVAAALGAPLADAVARDVRVQRTPGAWAAVGAGPAGAAAAEAVVDGAPLYRALALLPGADPAQATVTRAATLHVDVRDDRAGVWPDALPDATAWATRRLPAPLNPPLVASRDRTQKRSAPAVAAGRRTTRLVPRASH